MLKDDLKTLLGTSFAFYVKTQGFHWNVEGPDFPQYHKFLGKIYEEVYGSIDEIAEHIRTLDEYSPGSMTRLLELSRIAEQTKIPRAELMVQELLQDANTVIDILNECFASAEAENNQGVADYIAGRLDAFAKHRWMLRSITKTQRA